MISFIQQHMWQIITLVIIPFVVTGVFHSGLFVVHEDLNQYATRTELNVIHERLDKIYEILLEIQRSVNNGEH